MSLLRISSVLIALIFCPLRGAAQSDTLLIEIAAARAMQLHQYAKGQLGLDPQLAADGHAPGGGYQSRPSTRTEAIARAINANVRRYSDVSNCGTDNGCRLTGVAAHLMLSEPSISGDTARVTATIRQNTPSSRQPQDYETTLIILTKRAGSWSVVREQQLGIS